jgi:hypothetical protein
MWGFNFSDCLWGTCILRIVYQDKIKNIFFDQIDKQLELVNISMNSTSQTTNQISSDCYKETIKMSTTRDNMPKWNIDTTTTNYDYSLINNSQDTCTSQTIREVKTPHIITMWYSDTLSHRYHQCDIVIHCHIDITNVI